MGAGVVVYVFKIKERKKTAVKAEHKWGQVGCWEEVRGALTLSGPSYSPCSGYTWAWGWACSHLWCRSGPPAGPGRDPGHPPEVEGEQREEEEREGWKGRRRTKREGARELSLHHYTFC